MPIRHFSLRRTSFFALIHGQAAVTFFFVLSGFVLTHRYFCVRDKDIIWRGALKRWPRLAAPALIVVLVAWVGFVLDIYWYREASMYFKTPWLETFGSGSPEIEVVRNFWFALEDGAVLSFFRRGSNYDSNLWTMTWELGGSMMIFALALLAVRFRRVHVGVRIVACCVAFVLAGAYGPLLSAFIAGAVLSWVYAVRPFQIHPLLATFGLLIAFYLAGYSPGSEPYDWLTTIGAGIQYGQYVWILASALAIVSIESSAMLAKHLSGRTGRFLGSMSFPIYLVQIVVICSIGAYVFVATVNVLPYPFPGLLACVVCIAGTFVAALPLRSFDLWWVPAISKVAAIVLDWIRAVSTRYGIGTIVQKALGFN